MSQQVYIMKCPGCGAALAGNLQACPYCGGESDLAALLPEAGMVSESHKTVLKSGGQLQIGTVKGGGKQERECPHCSATVLWSDETCEYCKNPLIIKSISFRRPTLVEGDLKVGGGGTVKVDERLELAGDVELTDGGSLEVSDDVDVSGNVRITDEGRIDLKGGTTMNITGSLILNAGGNLAIEGDADDAQKTKKDVPDDHTYSREEKFLKAAARGDLKAVRKYLKKGVDVNHESPGGSALYLAVDNAHLDVARYLVAMGADPDFIKEGKGIREITEALGDDSLLRSMR